MHNFARSRGHDSATRHTKQQTKHDHMQCRRPISHRKATRHDAKRRPGIGPCITRNKLMARASKKHANAAARHGHALTQQLRARARAQARAVRARTRSYALPIPERPHGRASKPTSAHARRGTRPGETATNTKRIRVMRRSPARSEHYPQRGQHLSASGTPHHAIPQGRRMRGGSVPRRTAKRAPLAHHKRVFHGIAAGVSRGSHRNHLRPALTDRYDETRNSVRVRSAIVMRGPRSSTLMPAPLRVQIRDASSLFSPRQENH